MVTGLSVRFWHITGPGHDAIAGLYGAGRRQGGTSARLGLLPSAFVLYRAADLVPGKAGRCRRHNQCLVSTRASLSGVDAAGSSGRRCEPRSAATRNPRRATNPNQAIRGQSSRHAPGLRLPVARREGAGTRRRHPQ
jgi:hypothetical protein